jgi:flagellar motility protein MotE (MotC chaperone)
MSLRPRLIPCVIVAATVLLGLKVSDVLSTNIAGIALASTPGLDAKATGMPIDLTKAANLLASLSPAEGHAEAAKPEHAEEKKSEEKKEEKPKAAAEGAPKPTQTAEAPAGEAPPSPRRQAKDPVLLSPAEIEILQQLSERRATLDQRAGEIDQRDVVMQAAEKRIDDKIKQLQDMQNSIAAAVQKQNDATDEKTQSLVKIYETMKPKEAAAILNQLDMPVLLNLLSHMKESKTAPIFAAMDPSKAKAVTTSLVQANQKPPAPMPAPQP